MLEFLLEKLSMTLTLPTMVWFLLVVALFFLYKEKEKKNKRPKVGIGVMIFKNGKILLGKRKGSHGGGEWSWPGGHMEYMESFYECVIREVREEAGIEIQNIKFLKVSNLKDYAPKHYVDIGFVADWSLGEPKILEPKKCSEWKWFDIDNLPTPLFKTLPIYIEAYKTGKVFWDEYEKYKYTKRVS